MIMKLQLQSSSQTLEWVVTLLWHFVLFFVYAVNILSQDNVDKTTSVGRKQQYMSIANTYAIISSACNTHRYLEILLRGNLATRAISIV